MDSAERGLAVFLSLLFIVHDHAQPRRSLPLPCVLREVGHHLRSQLRRVVARFLLQHGSGRRFGASERGASR